MPVLLPFLLLRAAILGIRDSLRPQYEEVEVVKEYAVYDWARLKRIAQVALVGLVLLIPIYGFFTHAHPLTGLVGLFFGIFFVLGMGLVALPGFHVEEDVYVVRRRK